jgi:RNA polymerase sigma factor (sigma-70 family)
MLGSLADADDLLQETLLTAWRGLDSFAGRSSLRAWLYRIATNRCINAIRDDRRRRPVAPVPPFDPPEPSRRGEVTWLQPYPDPWLEQAADTGRGPAAQYQARETVELAFITALQRLPSRQTAALLLCDVLGFGTAEVAAMLAMPPAPHEYHGSAAVATFLRASADWRGRRHFRLVPCRANTQPAFACYLPGPDQSAARATGILVLTLSGNRIRGITRFLDDELPRLFGLADALD